MKKIVHHKTYKDGPFVAVDEVFAETVHTLLQQAFGFQHISEQCFGSTMGILRAEGIEHPLMNINPLQNPAAVIHRYGVSYARGFFDALTGAVAAYKKDQPMFDAVFEQLKEVSLTTSRPITPDTSSAAKSAAK